MIYEDISHTFRLINCVFRSGGVHSSLLIVSYSYMGMRMRKKGTEGISKVGN